MSVDESIQKSEDRDPNESLGSDGGCGDGVVLDEEVRDVGSDASDAKHIDHWEDALCHEEGIVNSVVEQLYRCGVCRDRSQFVVEIVNVVRRVAD